MSYSPTSWQTGDVVDAADLNKIEQGIAGAVRVTTMAESEGTYTLGNTWQEIHDWIAAGSLVIALANDGAKQTFLVYANEASASSFVILDVYGDMVFSTSSADGYPTSDVPR